MFKSSPVKKLERLLRDFPWLWAIRKEWDPWSIGVSVRYADETDIWGKSFDIPKDGEVWIHLCQGDIEKLHKAGHAVMNPSLGRLVYASARRTGGDIQHVAILHRGAINIFRGRGGQDPRVAFDRFLEGSSYLY